MKHSLSCGDKVMVIGGKYVGRLGHGLKLTDKMCSVRLHPSEDVIRVMSHNVQRHEGMPVRAIEKVDRLGPDVCSKPCCGDRMDALNEAKEEIIMMRARMKELIELLENMSTG